ncbi:MAG: AAA family ATPase [Gaiellales bacterium]
MAAVVDALPLPGPLRLTPSFPFVGRQRQLAALRTLMPAVEGEGRRAVLIGGEAGSGKSRLAREFAREVASGGALVLYGACDAVVRTPYQPFVEALDHLVRHGEPAWLREAVGTGGGELARLLPDLSRQVPGLPAPVPADPDTERHRLHTAVTELLAGVGRRWPILLVLEDLHWSDTPSLLLLRHLVRVAGEARMLILATFRDLEADVPAELSDALADLRRLEDVLRLRLTGLSDPEVAEFVQRAVGARSDPALSELARTLGELTNGNAFLMCEVWRALVEAGGLELVDGVVAFARPLGQLASPESVREIVSQRLSRLSAVATDLLELAAVAGPEFEVAALRRATGLDNAVLGEALAEASRSGMIEELDRRELSYRFAHELVRRALYDRLTALRRAELHLRVALALEQATQPGEGRVLAGLAYHFAAAAPLGDLRKAVDYNVLAARQARGSLAFDDAAKRLSIALELGIDGPTEQVEARLELGAAHHAGGKALDALATFRAAFEEARTLADPERLALAAIGYEEACWRPGISDAGAAELVAEAVEALGESESPLRVRLLAGLARALDFQGEHARADSVRQVAIEMARRIGDRRGLATVLMRAYWGYGELSMETIATMLVEARRLAEEIGDVELEVEAREWQIPALIALCDLQVARREIEEVLELAQRTRQPFNIHVAEHQASSIALADGRLGDAEAAAGRSHEWSRLLSGRDASGVYGIQMFGIRREQGRLAELAPVVRVLASADGSGAWGPGFAVLLAELGMEDRAGNELARIRHDGLEALRERLWIASLAYLADACSMVGDAELASVVYPELSPYRGGSVMVGHGVACYGAADRLLGMLAVTVGEHRLAEAHFEAAMTLNARMGALTWLAHTAYQYGRLLLRGGAAEDARRAEALFSQAVEIAERTGLVALKARLASLTVSPNAARLPDGLSPREVDILRLLAGGLSNRELGSELFISEHTVANHVRSILRKTGCANRTEAASYAFRRGLVRS